MIDRMIFIINYVIKSESFLDNSLLFTSVLFYINIIIYIDFDNMT